MKNVVWDSTLSNAILYSCETWVVKDITAVQTQYMSSVTDLLGVRTQTPSNLIYVELDIPSLQALVRRTQISFLKKAKNSTHFEVSSVQMAKDSQSPIIISFIWTCIKIHTFQLVKKREKINVF